MNLTQFAKHIGVSQPRVTKYIQDVTIKKALTPKGKRFDINEKIAIQELKKNLDQGRKVKALNKVDKKPKTKAKAKKAIIPEIKDLDFNAARTLNERYKAELKKIELDEKQKRLVPAVEIKQAWVSHVAAVKLKLLGISSKLAPVIREIIEDADISETILQAIESEIEGALTELARSKI